MKINKKEIMELRKGNYLFLLKTFESCFEKSRANELNDCLKDLQKNSYLCGFIDGKANKLLVNEKNIINSLQKKVDFLKKENEFLKSKFDTKNVRCSVNFENYFQDLIKIYNIDNFVKFSPKRDIKECFSGNCNLISLLGNNSSKTLFFDYFFELKREKKLGNKKVMALFYNDKKDWKYKSYLFENKEIKEIKNDCYAPAYLVFL